MVNDCNDLLLSHIIVENSHISKTLIYLLVGGSAWTTFRLLTFGVWIFLTAINKFCAVAMMDPGVALAVSKLAMKI